MLLKERSRRGRGRRIRGGYIEAYTLSAWKISVTHGGNELMYC